MDAAACDHRALIALANPNGNFRWHQLIAAIAAHDRDFAAADPPTHKVVCRDSAYFVAVDEIVSLICLSSGQAVLLDELLDLRLTGFLIRLLLPLPVQLLVAIRFGELRPLRSQLSIGRRRAPFFRELLSSTLLLPHLPFGFLGLLFIDQARLQ